MEDKTMCLQLSVPPAGWTKTWSSGPYWDEITQNLKREWGEHWKQPGAKEKGHVRGKQADCPVDIWADCPVDILLICTKQWKKKIRQELKVKAWRNPWTYQEADKKAFYVILEASDVGGDRATKSSNIVWAWTKCFCRNPRAKWVIWMSANIFVLS